MAEPWYDRLDETGRACDECGKRIGRWTHKCRYDENAHRCYCSSCSAAFSDAPRCEKCGEPVNPLRDGSARVTVGSLNLIYCASCSAQAPGSEAPLPNGLVRIAPSPEVELTDAQRDLIALGPYFVVRTPWSTPFQVVRLLPDGKLEARASLSNQAQVFLKCADFNAEV